MNYQSAPRILVIDDDQQKNQELQEMFKPLGYMVEISQGHGHALIRDALARAERFRPHVAIIDLRLDETDELMGLKLLKGLSSAHCVIYSAYINAEVSRAAEKYGATVIDKDEAPQNVIDLINKTAQRKSASKRMLPSFKKGWSETVIKALLGESANAPASLVDDVVAQLFPESRKIVLETLDQSIVTPQSVSRGRSIVMKVFHDNRIEPHVVKIATSEAIEREAKNYKQYIEGNLVGRFNANLVGEPVVFWDLGGVLYSILDHTEQKLMSFHEFYEKQSDPIKIINPLRHFYKNTWGKLYEQAETCNEELGTYYDRIFHLKRRMKAFSNKDEQISIPGIKVSLPNPVQWVIKHIQDSSTLPFRLAVTHGDLHGDNLFVDQNYSWAIDFERSGPGHVLRDFIEMEVDVFTRLGPGASGSQINEQLFLTGLSLTGNLDSYQNKELQSRLNNSRLIKALAVIQEQRQICSEIAHPSDFREYLWALLFDVVFLATLVEQNRPQRDRALLLGGIICERLKYGLKDGWPPEQLLAALPSIASILPSEQHDNILVEKSHESTAYKAIRENMGKRLFLVGITFLLTIVGALVAVWEINRINPSPWTLGATFLVLLPIAVIFATVVGGLVSGSDGIKAMRDIVINALSIRNTDKK
jgi:CheY-like chemotaxis protein